VLLVHAFKLLSGSSYLYQSIAEAFLLFFSFACSLFFDVGLLGVCPDDDDDDDGDGDRQVLLLRSQTSACLLL